VFQVLSEEHAQNILVCLPQDLYTLYVYWDFTGLRNQIVKNFLQRVRPEYQLSVRLCRIEPESGQFSVQSEIPLQQINFGNYYFRQLNPVNTYCFELGAKKPDGGFICFYQTHPVRMQPSDENDRLIMIEEEFKLNGEDGVAVPESLDDFQRNQQLFAMSSWT